MKVWATKFKCGRKNLREDVRARRPKTITTDDNTAKVHQMVLER